jgi:histidine triad (HIT) family protein
MTIFEKIARREIPAEIIYEEDDFMVIRDIHAQAPVHVLLVPKKVIPRLGEAQPGEDAAILGKMLAATGQIARMLGVYDSGYRVVINHGADAGETVPHLHMHLLGKRPLSWPPG